MTDTPTSQPETLDKEEAVALLTGPFGKQLSEIAMNAVAPLWWGRPPFVEPYGGISHQGCIFFLRLDGSLIAVTADHVFEKFRSERTTCPDLACYIFNLPFDPECELIDRDKALDIATFHIDERTIRVLGKNPHCPPISKWPPRPPEEGKGVFFAGFLLSEREAPITSNLIIMPKPKIAFKPYSLVITATSVNDRNVNCQIDHHDLISICDPGARPKKHWLGSFSGAPLWALVKTPFWHWRLGGIIIEYLEEWELLIARRPDSITQNGTILHQQV